MHGRRLDPAVTGKWKVGLYERGADRLVSAWGRGQLALQSGLLRIHAQVARALVPVRGHHFKSRNSGLIGIPYHEEKKEGVYEAGLGNKNYSSLEVDQGQAMHNGLFYASPCKQARPGGQRWKADAAG